MSLRFRRDAWRQRLSQGPRATRASPLESFASCSGNEVALWCGENVLHSSRMHRTARNCTLGKGVRAPTRPGTRQSQPRGGQPKPPAGDPGRGAWPAGLRATVPGAHGELRPCAEVGSYTTAPRFPIGVPWHSPPRASRSARPPGPARRTHRSRHWASLRPGTSARILNQSCSPYLATARSNFCRRDRQ